MLTMPVRSYDRAMRSVRLSHVEAYIFRRRLRRVEFLVLRRSSQRRKLPGIWQPVTGHTKTREPMFRAALREVREETGLEPLRWWALESPTLTFDADLDAVIALPLFAAEVDAEDSVRLSPEHDAHAFVSAAEAGRRFLWETQRRALAAISHDIVPGGRLARALEVHGLIRRRAPTAHAPRRRVSSIP